MVRWSASGPSTSPATTRPRLPLAHPPGDPGAPYHRAAPVQAFFEQHRDRLHVIRLPSYSPDYNPIEFLWRATKRSATHNR